MEEKIECRVKIDRSTYDLLCVIAEISGVPLWELIETTIHEATFQYREKLEKAVEDYFNEIPSS